MRDTKPQRRRNRIVTVLLLPVLAVMWLIGWSLTWVGTRKDEAQPKPPRDRRADHVKLFPANTVLREHNEEEDEQVEIAAIVN